MNNFSNEELKFPLDWEYRIVFISEHENDVKLAIKETIKGYNLAGKITTGLVSQGGKYHTLKVPVKFENKEDLEVLSKKLSLIENIKFIL